MEPSLVVGGCGSLIKGVALFKKKQAHWGGRMDYAWILGVNEPAGSESW